MNRKFLFTVLALAALSLALGATRASAWQKDPNSQVDLAHVVGTALLSEADTTIGDADASLPGLAGTETGSGDLSAYHDDGYHGSGSTLWVDDSPLDNDCTANAYPSIQAAIDASGPNATIKVCPGTYAEQPKVIGHNHDGLMLQSVVPLAATIQWPTVETNHQLIYVNDADRVRIMSFKISGPFPAGGCFGGPPPTDRHEGVLFDHAFHGRLDHNRITLIRDAVPALWGCQQGDAVSIGRRQDVPLVLGPAASAQVDHNYIDRYQKNGLQAVNPDTYAAVLGNTIVASADAALQAITASNGIVVFRQAAGDVEGNSVSGNHYTATPLSTGIVLDEAPAWSSAVEHNRVFDNDYGIETDTQSGLSISHNDVDQNRSDAITVCGDPAFGCGFATQIIVRSNEVEHNGGSGIALFGADYNLLKTNHVEDNGTAAGDTTDGIRIDSLSDHNWISTNHMDDNVAHDCHDDSAGSGTAGTANYWFNDFGSTENRDGLCRPGDDDDH